MKSKELKITLKSDLCVGSGYSYAGIADSDICYDDCGLPYIPAKRLKGCLREAAELIGLPADTIEKLFGIGGTSGTGFILSNAYISNYENIYRELKCMDSAWKVYVSPQNVLEQFTVIKAQTKIMDNGIAKDNSLRFTRAVKHYSPIDKNQEMIFVADVEVDEADEKNLEMVAKALRNIGMNRNRGLGSVVCALTDSSKEYMKVLDLSEISDDEDTYVLQYTVRNTSPLVLNVDNNYTTEKYISGQNVLGFFASAYLKVGNSAENETFAELFLKNQVIFSGLYPYDGDIYYPAPSYINRLKKTKEFVNVSKEIPMTEQDCEQRGISGVYARGNGNQSKKLKGKFVCIKEDGVLLKEVKSDIVYHHTKKSKRQDSQDGELLYSFETVRGQQLFAGTITGKGKYIKQLCALLESGKMQFGKSKSAQYGTCVLEGVSTVRAMDSVAKKYEKGSRLLITLQSDGVFAGKTGYIVRCDEVRAILKETLGIKEPEECKIDALYAEVEVRELIGFYGKWNLKRQAIPVVRAGSTFEFVLAEDLLISEKDLYAGERIGEGYGKLVIRENDGDDCRIWKAKAENAEVLKADYAKEICRDILLQEMREYLRNAALKEEIRVQNASTVGRITLMLSESLNQYPDDADKAYENFCERIGSIKDKEKKEQIARLKNQLVCENETLTIDRLKYLKCISPLVSLYEETFGQAEKEVKGLWSDYFMSVLVQEKYKQKGRKDDYEED